MERIGEVLKAYLSSLNFTQKLREQEVIKKAREYLESQFDIDGEIDYEKGILKISLSDASLKYEILLKRDVIINSINKLLGTKEINKILVIT